MVFAKSRRQRAMLGRIVKRNPAIEIRSPPAMFPVNSKEMPMSSLPDHERNGRALLLGKRKELRREVARGVAVKCHKVCSPEAVEDREQH